MPNELVERAETQSLIVMPHEQAQSATVDMAVVRRAIHLERKLHIHYTDAKGATSDLVIWPFLLIYFDGGLLISAWCENNLMENG